MATLLGLCPLLASMGPGDQQHVRQTESALLLLSVEWRGGLGAAGKVSMDRDGE